jgi:hypothetical protein
MPAVHELYPHFQNDFETFNKSALEIAHKLACASHYGAATLYATQPDVTKIVASATSDDLAAIPRCYLQTHPMFGMRGPMTSETWKTMAHEMAHRDPKVDRALERYSQDIRESNHLFLLLVRQTGSYNLGFASVMFASDHRLIQNLTTAAIREVASMARDVRTPLYTLRGTADLWLRRLRGSEDQRSIEINNDDSLFTAVQPVLHS